MGKKRSTGFAVRLRSLRIAAGLTQAQLAEKAGMHLHGLTKIEQGDREPAWATVLDLATALGVDCKAFTGESNSPPEQLTVAEEKPAKKKAKGKK